MSRLKPRPVADNLGGSEEKEARGFACPFLFVERLDLWSLQVANCCDE